MEDLPQERLDAARALVEAASRVVVLTGAGISTDSGIRDYRGPQGVWTRNPGAERMATLDDYVSSADVRSAAWQHRIEAALHERDPNVAHRALVSFEREGKLHTLITQNVDGLHASAGTSADLLIEIHGTACEVVCLSCGERTAMQDTLDRVHAGESDPACRSCQGILKSATISFGQPLDTELLERAREAAAACDLLMAIGSTLSVYPVADLVPVAKASGARVLILNGQATPMDGLADMVLHGSISAVLPGLVGHPDEGSQGTAADPEGESPGVAESDADDAEENHESSGVSSGPSVEGDSVHGSEAPPNR